MTSSCYAILTEAQIEARIERAMDRLDNQLISGRIDQYAYDLRVAELDRWADQEYSLARAKRHS